MFEAGKKYFSFSSTPSVEIKDIVNAELPEIYVCRKDLNYMDKLDESEYASLSAFLAGKSIIYSPENVTQVGEYNLIYENLTTQIYPGVNLLNIFGNPSNIGHYYTNRLYYSALKGFCYKIELNARIVSHPELFYLEFNSFDTEKL